MCWTAFIATLGSMQPVGRRLDTPGNLAVSGKVSHPPFQFGELLSAYVVTHCYLIRKPCLVLRYVRYFRGDSQMQKVDTVVNGSEF